MYRGFIVDGISFANDYEKDGAELLESYKTTIHQVLDSVNKSLDVPLDGSAIQDAWFPTNLQFDVFISHSHRDLSQAKRLAGFLKYEFGLTSFIDSCIWGHADKLLRAIDNIYCYDPESETYRYSDRNGSTAHVHMMLTNALMMMIDRCESVFFLSTPNSLITAKESVSKTLSPWIYTEIGITKRIRRKDPGRGDLMKALNESIRLFSATKLNVEYTLDMGHLDQIGQPEIEQWRNEFNSIPKRHNSPLDYLYEQIPA